jgi:hypothetical protein
MIFLAWVKKLVCFNYALSGYDILDKRSLKLTELSSLVELYRALWSFMEPYGALWSVI